MEREAYFDCEKPLPEVGSGDYVQYIIQSNFIIQYRILERGVYKFEEVTEGDEDTETELVTETETDATVES